MSESMKKKFPSLVSLEVSIINSAFLNSDLIFCNSKLSEVELIAAFMQFRFVAR